MYARLSYYFSICTKRARMAHSLHDISGDIRILKSRYYPNISAAVRRWVLRADAISSGISRADPRAAVSWLSLLYVVVCCCLRAILWIYNHSLCRIRYIM